jgi:hypothetical protein
VRSGEQNGGKSGQAEHDHLLAAQVINKGQHVVSTPLADPILDVR